MSETKFHTHTEPQARPRFYYVTRLHYLLTHGHLSLPFIAAPIFAVTRRQLLGHVEYAGCQHCRLKRGGSEFKCTTFDVGSYSRHYVQIMTCTYSDRTVAVVTLKLSDGVRNIFRDISFCSVPRGGCQTTSEWQPRQETLLMSSPCEQERRTADLNGRIWQAESSQPPKSVSSFIRMHVFWFLRWELNSQSFFKFINKGKKKVVPVLN
jgi:hypothetical protein